MDPWNAIPSWQPHPPTSLRPSFYIMRPGNQAVPLLPMDELPNWLQVVQNRPFDPRKMHQAGIGYFPRLGEYDIICLYCASALESLSEKSTGPSETPHYGQSQTALIQRSYPGSLVLFVNQLSPALSSQAQGLPQYPPQSFRLDPNARTFSPGFGAPGSYLSLTKSNGLTNSTSPNTWFAFSPNLQAEPCSDETPHTEYENILSAPSKNSKRSPALNTSARSTESGLNDRILRPCIAVHGHPESRVRKSSLAIPKQLLSGLHSSTKDPRSRKKPDTQRWKE